MEASYHPKARRSEENVSNCRVLDHFCYRESLCLQARCRALCTAARIEQNLLVCEPPLGMSVHIMALGTIEIADVLRAAQPAEKLKELLDYPNKLNKRGTARDRCMAIYHEYLEYPCEATRERLREAYEAVPDHERMYLGKMASKDWDYQRILFEPDKKGKFSLRKFAFAST